MQTRRLPQKLRFRNSAGEVSDPITTICTENYQHTLVPNKGFWFQIEDTGVGGTLHGYLYKDSQQVAKLQTAPIAVCFTATGAKITTLLELSRDPQPVKAAETVDWSWGQLLEEMLDHQNLVRKPSGEEARATIVDLASLRPEPGSKPN